MKTIYCTLLFIVLVMTGCSKASQPNDPIPEHETFTIDSKKVGEIRTINVWLPSDYASTTDSLAVLYMLDGGLKEDFPHIANTLAELISSKKIQPIILVGIENTQRRRDLTGETKVENDKEIAPVVGESDKFRSFVSDELFSEINKKYRTTDQKGIIGESLAGLFVVETFLLHPKMFDFYIAFDPSLWWNDQYLLKTAKEHVSNISEGQQKRFWFAGSKALDIAPVTRGLAEVLETEKLPNLKWTYSDEPKEEHHTIFRATKEKALIWTLNENKE